MFETASLVYKCLQTGHPQYFDAYFFLSYTSLYILWECGGDVKRLVVPQLCTLFYKLD